MRTIAVAIAAVASVAWFAWPYLSAYETAQAINDGDTVALETQVSWPQVRQGFKDDLNAVVPSLTNELQAGAFGGLFSTLAPVMVDKMVDAYMTPSGFATNLRKQKLRWRDVKYAFFTSPTSFRILLGNPEGSDDTRLEVKMQFQDFGWKVTRVYLPVKKMFAVRNEATAVSTRTDVFKTSESVKPPSLFEPVQSKSSETASNVANSEYIDKVRLYDFQARYIKTMLDGKVPSVTFKLKNEGSKTLKRVEVTVYFKDSSGNIITEESYSPVLVTKFPSFGSDNNKPLKPGYIWQIESGKSYTARSVPSEWAEGRAEAKITRVEIDDAATSNEDKQNPQRKR